MSIREGVLDTLGADRAVLAGAGIVPLQLGGWAAGAIRQVAPLLAETNIRPAGSTSLTVAPVTSLGPEFVTVDKHGSVFGGEPRPRQLRKYVKVR